ncbi:GGDEF domain-containing protein [Vibrio makurazakiensis]|uniref:GGDEF domain-containing protein n=1 Tax=Vibrio makurazakiensis TaxID=2910250 RepID=UPI003D136092
MPYAKFVYIPIVMFMGFVITDIIHFADSSYLPVILRMVTCAGMIASAYYCLQYRPRYFQTFESGLLIVASLFLVYVGQFAIGLQNYDYQGGLLLVMIYIGTFSRMSARYSVPSLIVAFLCYIAGLAPLLYDIDPHHEIESISIHVSAFILIVAACFRRDLEVNKRFIQAQQLRKQAILLRQQTRKFKALSYVDSLTQCFNRLYLHQILEPKLNQQESVTIYMLDLDFFKSVNDTYGHTVGDRVLRETASNLMQLTPANAHCIRYGGEEFLVLAAGLTQEQSLELGDTFLSATQTIKLPNQKSDITLSVGATFSTHTSSVLDTLIEQADQALYHSKENGRNQTSWHS